MMPGATALTRMPAPAWLAAAARTRPSTPALAAATASWLGVPICAAADETSTAAPGRRALRKAPTNPPRV
jgi:hypothetical protein